MKTPKNKKKQFNPKKTTLIVILLVAIAGIVALVSTQAATYDGYQRIRILNAATAELGNREWNARVLTYSEGNRENWCADFVSWVYLRAGYPFNAPAGPGRSSWRIPLVYIKNASVPNLRDYLKTYNAYKVKESGYIPGVGDIVIFARQNRSHTGIVERVDTATKSTPIIFTIEGNTSTNDVARRSYLANDGTIDGYGTIINSQPKK
jgi:hypothetical protein